MHGPSVKDWAGGRPIRSLRVAFGDRMRYGQLGRYVSLSRSIPGWCRDDEAVALARLSLSLPGGAVIVEIGSFLGCSTVLLAGARKLAGSGTVHSVDPFDGSGDGFSIPYYKAIQSAVGRPLREEFDRNVRRAGVSAFVDVHEGLAVEVAASFGRPVDLLFMDGDQSPEGVRDAYDAWEPLLKVGGFIALHSSTSREPGHDGSYRLAQDTLRAPKFSNVQLIRTTTFGRKTRG